jgi:hypothetical protein
MYGRGAGAGATPRTHGRHLRCCGGSVAGTTGWQLLWSVLLVDWLRLLLVQPLSTSQSVALPAGAPGSGTVCMG